VHTICIGFGGLWCHEDGQANANTSSDRINAELRRGMSCDARTGEFESTRGLAPTKTLREVGRGKVVSCLEREYYRSDSKWPCR